jgi:hypothetical protein
MAIDAKQRIQAWRTTTERQYHPREADKLAQAMKATTSRLYDGFLKLPDAEAVDLIETLTVLSEQHFAFAYYNGFRHGELGRSSPRRRAEAFIADLCLRHPDWTTKLIFAALDDEGIPLVFHGKVKRKNAVYWLDVVREPAYMMFVSRLKDKMGQESRLKGWGKIMQRHTKLRKLQNSG